MRRPVLRYHGGKFRLAPWIVSFFPKHRVYVEPYGGAASVLMRKPRAFGEVYNDMDEEVVNVFRVLRDPQLAGDLQRLLELTPYARKEFYQAYEPMTDEEAMADGGVERARRTIIKAFMGFGSDAIHRPGPRGMRTTVSTGPKKHRTAAFRAGGLPGSTGRAAAGRVIRRSGGTGFRPSSDQNGATPAWDFATWPEQIPVFTERLRGVAIECRDALELIDQFDKPGYLIYCDPPYVRSTRRTADRNGYSYEMTDDDHRALAERLRRAEAMVVISGYPSELYDEELYPDWRRETKTGYADARHRERVEVLWLNEAVAARTGQTSLKL